MTNISRLKNKTILLIEDEKVIRENIASMLRCFFKEVYTAYDGLDGYRKYKIIQPNIINHQGKKRIEIMKIANILEIPFIERIEKAISAGFG